MWTITPWQQVDFKFRVFPRLLVLKDGREIDRIVGLQPKQEILRRLQSAIAK